MLVYIGDDSLQKAFSLRSVVLDGHESTESLSQSVLKDWEECVVSILIQS